MATTPAALYRGTLSTTVTTTLYTVPAATSIVATNIVLTNKSANATTVTLDMDGAYLAYQLPIAAAETIVLDMRQVLATGKTIRGGAAAATTVDCHISGVTIA